MGFSLSKVLFTVFAVLAVWYGFKWVTRVQARRRAEIAQRMQDEARGRTGAPTGPRRTAVEDMAACSTCGAYVPTRGAVACGRPDCPYPG